jgi:hypothetical protein
MAYKAKRSHNADHHSNQTNPKRSRLSGHALLETLQDIQKNGRMMYSERTMEAFVVFMQQGQALFAPVDE